MEKLAIVSGSSRGLGLEIAKALSYENFSIVLNGRNEKLLGKAMAVLNQTIRHYPFCCDFQKEDSLEALRKFLKYHDLAPDVIVHNLGGKIAGDSHPIDMELLNETMTLNLNRAIEINNLCIPLMMEKGGGRIVHIGSSAGISGNASPAYAISKGALHIYIKNAARYYAKDRIMICGVVPGVLDHEGSEWDRKRTAEPEKYNSRLKDMPLGRFASPEEIAPFIKAVCCIESMQCTGSLITLDGGV